MTPRPMTVLMSFPPPRPTSNPYNSLLMDAVAEQPGVTVLTFSWRRLLFGDYDLFHVHWPEILVDGRSWWKKKVRQAFFAAALLRLRATRRPLVRTLHNLELPSGISATERVLLRWAERWTTWWIVINPTEEIPEGRPFDVALHGHYRTWYAKHPAHRPVPGRLGFFGMIRRYKNAVGLVTAFRRTDSPDLSLKVCGKPSTEELAAEITRAADGDPRITLVLDFLDEAALVAQVTDSELVVLPYPEMHNSGSVFAALSLDRPVLVPDNEVNRRLADEVGHEWVLMYSGELSGEHLEQGIERVRSTPAGTRPDLAQRDWDVVAAHHVRAYRHALSRSRRRPSREGSRPAAHA
ncbi:hypothetical protein [Actinomyces polynesiensis]|uniref:hypothetical protein n=1 Tax=Actinomyces polynesiensis TaxID=1325934 RepID=UPI0005B98D89|nr:hypothetical protein [Actinomyces polynesiensis]